MARRFLAIGLLAAALTLCGPLGAASATAPPRASLVVVVLAPYLTWDDVTGGHAPYLDGLVDESAVGDLNVTSLAPGAGDASAENGALMLSAGTWTRFDASADGAVPMPCGGILYRGLAQQTDAQAGSGSGARPGALGNAVVSAGGVTAAIGDADLGVEANSDQRRVSPAVLMAMDGSGSVRLGSVGSDLLSRVGPPAPFGVLSDESAIASALADVLAAPAVHRGPALVVMDPGDLARARASSTVAPGEIESLGRVAAVQELDTTVRRVRSSLPRGAVLVVAAPVAGPGDGTVSGFGPLIVNGPGWSGLVSSRSTRRQGLVTAADLTETIVSALGAATPPSAIGATMVPGGGPESSADRIAMLRQLDATVRSVDTARPFVVNAYIGLAVLALGLSVVILARPVVPPSAIRWGQLLLLLVLALPAAGVLMFLPVRYPGTPLVAVALLLASTTFLWTLATASHYSNDEPVAIAFLALLAALVLAADQWFGAPLSYSAFLGYSPLVGARFYGIGNEGAALLVGSFVTGATIMFDRHAARSAVPPLRAWGFPVVSVLVVVTAAAPFLGANIGVAVWGTFTLTLVWLRMTGRAMGWKSVLASLATAAVAVALLAGLDLLAPAAARTHVGTTLSSVGGTSGGLALTSMLARKVAMNVRFLTGSTWTILFAASVGALGWLRWRPPGDLRDMLVEHPDFAAGLTALLLGGLLAYLTEDSGVVVPALMLLFPTAAAMYLMLMHRAQEGEE